ncbi:hypothetical protein HDU97_005849 [Phlyctochytrium planicorne]|nr:hypothetical protein HDU97_005849 [Phlyctochytrium planicorne]
MWNAITSVLTASSIPYLQPSTDDNDASQSPEEDFVAGRNLFDAKNYNKAIIHLLRASNHGHAEAMKLLADCYDEDKLNDPEQKKLWESRREELLNDPEGMAAYAHSLRAIGEHIKAITWFRKAADLGNVESMHQVGIYLRKVGDGDDAMKWFEKAAEGGYDLAEIALAEGYEQGIGVERDGEKAAFWRQRIFEREKEAQQAKVEAALAAAKELDRRKAELESNGQNASSLVGESAEIKDNSNSSPTDETASAVSTSSIIGKTHITGTSQSLLHATSEALNNDYKEALRLLDWGSWSKGISLLDRLASQGHKPSTTYLDPSTTSLKNPTGMLYMCAHFAQTRPDDPILAFSWYTSAMARASKMASVSPSAFTPAFTKPALGTASPSQPSSFLLNIPLSIPPEIEPIIASVIPEVDERKKALAKDKELQSCLSNLEWGSWAKAFVGLERLAEGGDETAKVYLDPERSPMKNPSGMVHLAERLEARAGFCDEDVNKGAEDGDVAGDGEKGQSEREMLLTKAKKWRIRADEARKKMGLNPLFAPEIISDSLASLSITTPASSSAAAAASSPTASPSSSSNRTSFLQPKSPSSTPTAPQSLDSQHRTAISNIAWGSYEKGIATLFNLSTVDHHAPSASHLNPSTSPIRDPAAMYAIATHLEATGNPVHLDDAAAWHRKAAEAGHHRAMVKLGKLLAAGTGGKVRGVGDHWQAIAWYSRSWDVGGNGEAAYEMAKAFAWGVEVDVEEKEVKKKGSGGVGGEKIVKGKLVDVGEDSTASGTAGDGLTVPTAATSAEDKRRSQISLIDEEVPTDSTSSIPALNPEHVVANGKKDGKPSRLNSSDTLPATVAVPDATTTTSKKKKVIVKRDDAKAAEWAKRGAGKDHPGSLNLYGEMLREGRGIAENKVAAVQQFKRAANLGDAVAMFNLGTCLLHGIGVDADETQALLWLTRATKASQAAAAASASPQGGVASSMAAPVSS